MATASIFQNYVHLVEHKSLIIITKQIQEGKYKEQVEAIRKLMPKIKKKKPTNSKNNFRHSPHQALLKVAVRLNCLRNTADL